MRKTHRQHWIKLVRGNLEGYRDVLRWDLFEDWNRLTHPGLACERHLESALELLAGGTTGSLVETSLKRAVRFAERVVAEKKYQRGKARLTFPMSRGQTLRVLAFANWLLGKNLDLEFLRQAHRDMADWSHRVRAVGEWDEIGEGELLSAIAIALIAGELSIAAQYAGELPITRRRRQFQVITFICERVSEGNRVPSTFGPRFDSLFDQIRNPKKAELLPAFELAILRDMYVVPTRRPVNPRHCVKVMTS
jgi:hypothetical protein